LPSRSVFGGWKPMTLYRIRSQPGIRLSGNPPSKPLSLEKRATRFIICRRGMPRRGSVSRYAMLPS
jgi:hypothetical protein